MQVKSRLSELFSGAARKELEARLVGYIPPRRWFRSKTREVTLASLEHVVPLPADAAGGAEIVFTVVRVKFTQGPSEDYVLPLRSMSGDAGEQLARTRPDLVIGPIDVESDGRTHWLVDALGERSALEAIFALVARGATVQADDCVLTFRSLGEGLPVSSAAPRPIEAEQSNTSIVYGEACILKIVRKLEEGSAPDLEMGEFLTRAGYAHTPALFAAIELQRASSEPATVGVVHAFVSNQGDAWTFALATIAGTGEPPPAQDEADAFDQSIAFVRPLARRIAEMHSALAAPTTDARFQPQPIERSEREALGRAVDRLLTAAWALVDERAALLAPDAVDRLRAVRAQESAFRRCIARFEQGVRPCVKTRVHGDLHLGQVLVADRDFVFIDFEGEPARPLNERKAKRSPLVDVAGMLRSLHYASVAALRGAPTSPPSPRPERRALADAWHHMARREFLRAYFEAAGARSVLPEDAAAREVLLRFYLLEKCVYELHYEMNNRPDWVVIPVLGLERILEADWAGGHEQIARSSEPGGR